MGHDRTTQRALTRRDYVTYGSVAISGGILAGCTTGRDSEPEMTPSYTTTMAPMGEVAFEEVPETWLAFLSTYGDMGIALGQADGLRGLWNPADVPTEFYDYLPGVDVSLDDVTAIEGLDRETFYELDCDLHLMDPNWLEVIVDDWGQADTDEIAREVGPFLGNYIRRRGDDWHDYRYYSLYEAFEIVAEAFDESERFEALREVHDDLLSRVQSTLPSTEKRPSVGLVSVNSDFEGGSFYVYPVQGGNNHKQYRDLEMRGAFDDHIDGSNAQWDYEQLLEVDPDALLFQYGFSHVSTAEFDGLMDIIREDPLGRQLSAVQNDRLYRGGASYQGPIVNLFQTEAAAKQFYPETFGKWHGMETLADEDEQLFDRRRVGAVIEGDL